jgi:hypothetical protein
VIPPRCLPLGFWLRYTPFLGRTFDTLTEAKTILVVDDDLGVLSVMKHVLEGDDYNVLLSHTLTKRCAWRNAPI